MKDKIIEILRKHEEEMQWGSDGEYYTSMAVIDEEYEDVAKEIEELIKTILRHSKKS